ncbi:MAG TPA: hypothetical protein VHD60_01100 [Candidatus Saccharimonadales bacterium]|nr:hypothetical protein [Candidatus Saccharimonadales bacterium]
MRKRTRKTVYRMLAGDTIVEVMIALAVLGGALGVSYGIANRSLLQSRDAQERTSAVKLLQAQLEQLRSSGSISGTSVFSTSGKFCFYTDSSSGATGIVSWPNATTAPAKCQQGFYAYSLTRGADDTFSAVVQWDNVFGSGKDTATLLYRMHAPA